MCRVGYLELGRRWKTDHFGPRLQRLEIASLRDERHREGVSPEFEKQKSSPAVFRPANEVFGAQDKADDVRSEIIVGVVNMSEIFFSELKREFDETAESKFSVEAPDFLNRFLREQEIGEFRAH